MEALNALGLKPICFHLENRSKPRKISHFQALPIPKPSESARNGTNPSFISDKFRAFNGSLVLLSSVISTAKAAIALTYEEALEQSVTTSSGFDLDAGGFVDTFVDTITDNPGLAFGGVAAVALPLILSQVFGGKPKKFGVESARNAYAKLADEGDAQLLDIRSLKDAMEVGRPDIRGLKKKPVFVTYRSDDKPGFLKKLALKFKNPENTTLYILDKFDGNSELVAELVTANGFKAAYAIQDGAEGPRGWVNSGLPWILPRKSFSLDLGGLTDAITGVLPEGFEALPVTLGLAAVTGLGLFAFTEDRKQTLQQLDEFLSTKVAPQELVDDIKQIGSVLLPTTLSTKALPAPAEASSETIVTEQSSKTIVTEESSETIANNNSAPQADTPPEPAIGNNSAPKPDVKAEKPLAGRPRPIPRPEASIFSIPFTTIIPSHLREVSATGSHRSISIKSYFASCETNMGNIEHHKGTTVGAIMKMDKAKTTNEA
ncbi:Rhodanese-like domain-containing protein [Drosera capensis]